MVSFIRQAKTTVNVAMRKFIGILATWIVAALAVLHKETVQPLKTISLAEQALQKRQNPMEFASEKYMGLPKAAWVVIADVLAMILYNF